MLVLVVLMLVLVVLVVLVLVLVLVVLVVLLVVVLVPTVLHATPAARNRCCVSPAPPGTPCSTPPCTVVPHPACGGGMRRARGGFEGQWIHPRECAGDGIGQAAHRGAVVGCARPQWTEEN